MLALTWIVVSAHAAPCPPVTEALCDDLQAQLVSGREQVGARSKETGAKLKLPFLGGIGVGASHASEVSTQTVTLSQERLDALGDAVNACSAASRAPSPYTIELFWKRFALNVMGDTTFSCGTEGGDASAVAAPAPGSPGAFLRTAGDRPPEGTLIAGDERTRLFETSDGSAPSALGASFSSSDPAVATIDADGFVSPQGRGAAWIRAQAGGRTFELPVVVGRLSAEKLLVLQDGEEVAVPLPSGDRALVVLAVAADRSRDGVIVAAPETCFGGSTVEVDPTVGAAREQYRCSLGSGSSVRVKNPVGAHVSPVDVRVRAIEAPASASLPPGTRVPPADEVGAFARTWFVSVPEDPWMLRIGADGVGELRRGAASATVRVSQVVGSTAYASVEAVSDADRIAPGPVTLTLYEAQQQLLWRRAWSAPVPLCSSVTLDRATPALRDYCGQPPGP